MLFAMLAACAATPRPRLEPEAFRRLPPVGRVARAPDGRALPPIPPAPIGAAPQLWLVTPRGAPTLKVQRVSCADELGRLPSWTVSATGDGALPLERLLGQPVRVGVSLAGGRSWVLSGYVVKAHREQAELSPPSAHATERFRYRLEVAPWLGLLTKVATSQVFENLTHPEIVRRVFDRYGFADYEFRLRDTYPVQALSLQYKETDFNFVSRLLEQDGIYYFFEHRPSGSTLVLVDGPPRRNLKGEELRLVAPSAPAPSTKPDSPAPGPSGAQSSAETVRLTALSEVEVLEATRYSLSDYRFDRSRLRLEASTELPRDHALAGLTLHDYPGEFATTEAATWYTRRRAEEKQALARVIEGNVQGTLLQIGQIVLLEAPPARGGKQPYLVQSVHSDFASADEGGLEAGQYFSAVPLSQVFRPSRLTSKPVIDSVQTATVVASDSDPYGRIRVRFHWEESAGAAACDSAWLRVVQPLAAPTAARHGLLRPKAGQEVLVLFEEGDPNRPLAAGLLFNDQQRGKVGWPMSEVEEGPPTPGAP